VLRPVLNQMDKILRTRGLIGLVSWCKLHRLALLHYLSGEYPNKKVEGVSYYKDGFPRRTGLTREALASMPRLVMTLFFSTRALRLGTKPDLSVIQDPPKLEAFPVFPDPTKFWLALGFRRRKSTPNSFYWKGKFHMTTKAGPNGHALWSSLTDLQAIKDHPIRESIEILGGPRLAKAIRRTLKWWDLIPEFLKKGTGTKLRKLVWFADKEVKVRVVGELDYYSQTSLRGLHNYLFQILKKIPQDVTFNQGRFSEV